MKSAVIANAFEHHNRDRKNIFKLQSNLIRLRLNGTSKTTTEINQIQPGSTAPGSDNSRSKSQFFVERHANGGNEERLKVN